MSKRKSRNIGHPMIKRTINDENFAHCVKLAAIYAGCLTPDYDTRNVDDHEWFNQRTCIQIMAEVLIAYIDAYGPKPAFRLPTPGWQA